MQCAVWWSVPRKCAVVEKRFGCTVLHNNVHIVPLSCIYTVQYSCLRYRRSSLGMQSLEVHTPIAGADAVVLQSNCAPKICSRSPCSDYLGWGANPCSPSYRPTSLTNRLLCLSSDKVSAKLFINSGHHVLLTTFSYRKILQQWWYNI